MLLNNADRNSTKGHLRQLIVTEKSSLLDGNLKTDFLCSMREKRIGDPTQLIFVDEADRLKMLSLEQMQAIFDAEA